MTPCALVYGVLPVAALSGSPADGALVMLAFGAGTLPNLVFAGYAIQRASRWFALPVVRRSAALIVATFGVAGLYRVLFVPEVLANGPFCVVP
jgi:sulfite exporter TauE/SafE